jgi:phage tail sheath gpL-like
MGIDISVPTSDKVPGTFHEFDITSASRGLVAIVYVVAFIGLMLSGGTAVAATPYEVDSEGRADTLFGAGSELSLMCRAGFDAGRRYGNMPRLFAVAIADPAGTAATRTFTVTGTATAAGDVEVTVCGRVVRAAVALGDVQNTIAASLEAAIDSQNASGDTALPYTAGVATNVVTLTARQTGVNGNDGRITVVNAPAGVTVATASPIAGATAYTIAASLAVLVNRYYHGIAIANHTSTDITALATHITTMSLPQTKAWPQVVLAETASLSTGNTLATTANNMQISVINAELFPEMTGELAARACATLFAEEDPALHFNGAAITPYVPAAVDVPTYTEKKTALDAGATILSVNPENTAGVIVRFMTTKTTISGAAFLQVIDVTTPKTLFKVATNIDIRWIVWQQNAKNKKNTEGARDRLRSITIDVLYLAEEEEWIQNVEAHLGELQVETDSINKGRVKVAIPVSVVPGLHQLAGLHTLFVE